MLPRWRSYFLFLLGMLVERSSVVSLKKKCRCFTLCRLTSWVPSLALSQPPHRGQSLLAIARPTTTTCTGYVLTFLSLVHQYGYNVVNRM